MQTFIDFVKSVLAQWNSLPKVTHNVGLIVIVGFCCFVAGCMVGK